MIGIRLSTTLRQYIFPKKQECGHIIRIFTKIILGKHGRIHRYSHQSRRNRNRMRHGPVRDLVYSQGHIGHQRKRFVRWQMNQYIKEKTSEFKT